MKKSDVGVVAVFYAICAYFYVKTTQLPDSSQTYPMFTVLLVFGLTTLYLVQMIVAWKKHGVHKGTEEGFEEFLPKQFFFCLCATVLYLVLIYLFGFYIPTALFMVAVLLYLRVPKLAGLISVAAIILLVYLAFQRFLGVRLPTGIVMKLLK